MAFKNGLGERIDELRFSNPRSPPDDTPYSGCISPPRGQNNFMSTLRQPVNDARASLQRRFTEGSGKMSLTPIGQPTQAAEAIDMSSLVSCSSSSGTPFLSLTALSHFVRLRRIVSDA